MKDYSQQNGYELTNKEQQLVNILYERKENGPYVDNSDWGMGGYDNMESPIKEDFEGVKIIAITDWVSEEDNNCKNDMVESELVITEDFRVGYTCCDNTGYTCQSDYRVLGPYANYEEVVLMGLTNGDRKNFIIKYVGA